jgi:hypothetical protein
MSATTTAVELGAHPPRLRAGLSVGITGHRSLGDTDADRLKHELANLLATLRGEVEAIVALERDLFAPEPAELSVVLQLAAGVDQLAARVARQAGIRLRVILPHEEAAVRGEFQLEAEREAFDTLLAQADSVIRLTGTDGSPTQGFVLAGDATVAQAELLIAVWDGASPRGPGGTADVIAQAVRRGVPVLHLPVDGSQPAQILWAGFDGLAPDLLRPEGAPRRPLTPQHLRSVMLHVLAAPLAGEGREAVSDFLAEPERRSHFRPEWGLLQAAAGVRGLGPTAFRTPAYTGAAEAEWRAYCEAVRPVAGAEPEFTILEQAFAWADGLATYYATVYRSGLVFNFIAAALAVLVALGSLLLGKSLKVPLTSIELLLISGVIVNTWVGTRHNWHQRWLDYRYLAELLRPMRTLRLVGTAAPRLSPQLSDRDWTDWYAAGIWRSCASPPTVADGRALAEVAKAIADSEIEGQIAYHQKASRTFQHLDHRLHLAGLVLLYLTVGFGVGGLIAHFAAHDLMVRWSTEAAVLAAALPTIGGALFGIRGACDLEGAAARSATTADRLQRAATLLRSSAGDLASMTRALEEAASAMLADLGEWRTIYRNRKLAIPS